MDNSVYTPGAGHQPPFLAGRGEVLRDWSLSLSELVSRGRVGGRDVILTGPQGIGKTVTMTALAQEAERQGFEVVAVQAALEQVGLVESMSRRAEQRLEQEAGAWVRARRALERLESFSVGAAGVSIGASRSPAGGSRMDAGTLAEVLAELSAEIRADTPSGGLMLTVDELQAAAPGDLTLLSAALHRLNVDHPASVVAFAANGLTHTRDALESAGVTHPDRLFDATPMTPNLDPRDAAQALVEPARLAGVSWESAALRVVVEASGGYPAHLQLFADEAWRAEPGSTVITEAAAREGVRTATSNLAYRTWQPRADRLTDREVEYLAAVAVNGGRASARQLTHTLGRAHSEISQVRADLIANGHLYSVRRALLQYAEPLFGEFILSVYPERHGDAAVALLPLEDLQRNAASPAALAGAPQAELEPAPADLTSYTDDPPCQPPGGAG